MTRTHIHHIMRERLSETYAENRLRRIQEAAERPDPEEVTMSAAEAKRERKRLKAMGVKS